MSAVNPNSTARVGGHPLHPMVIPFPIAFLVSALVTDVIYLSTAEPGWATASMWLLGAGISMALLAAVLGFTDFFGDRRVRRIRDAWLHMIGNLVAVAVAAVNFYIRAVGGAEEALAPAGVTLSVAVVALLAFNGWKGWALVYKHHVGVSETHRHERAHAPVHVHTSDRRPG